MSSPVNERPDTTSAPAAPGEQPAADQPAALQRRRRLWGLALLALGVLILALNLGLLPDGVDRVAAVLWPVGVVAAGVTWLLRGQRLWPADPAPFRVARG